MWNEVEWNNLRYDTRVFLKELGEVTKKKLSGLPVSDLSCCNPSIPVSATKDCKYIDVSVIITYLT
jgi:hypothetical protein